MMIVNKEYKFNKEWLDLLLEHKNNENVTFNLSDNDTRILLTYIEVLQQENARLKDKFKDLEEWLEAMASMYENEYKDVNASEHYKCMLHKLKEN